jgi:Domain of unknown function (DUF4398)
MNVFQSRPIRALPLLAAVGGMMVLTACASGPPAPTVKLQAAQQAIVTAEQADAGHFASGELSEARAELTSANAAVSEQHMLVAERLADQSRTEAQLAFARTSYMKAQAVNDEMTRGNGALIQELQRSSGDKQ